jgi:hypothetical protein
LTRTHGKSRHVDLNFLNHPRLGDGERLGETRASKYASNDENGVCELATNSLKSTHCAVTRIVRFASFPSNRFLKNRATFSHQFAIS